MEHPFYCMTHNGFMVEHRLVMATFLNRPLEPWEIVHHKDGNKKNNTLENLEVMTNLGHRQLEALLEEVKKLRKRVEELEGK